MGRTIQWRYITRDDKKLGHFQKRGKKIRVKRKSFSWTFYPLNFLGIYYTLTILYDKDGALEDNPIDLISDSLGASNCAKDIDILSPFIETDSDLTYKSTDGRKLVVSTPNYHKRSICGMIERNGRLRITIFSEESTKNLMTAIMLGFK